MMGEDRAPQTSDSLEIVEGLPQEHVDDALRVTYHAFSRKFRIGFRDSEDLVQLFRASADRESCLTATVDGHLSGLLTTLTLDGGFYQVKTSSIYSMFGPLQATQILFTLTLLSFSIGESMPRDEFKVDTIAVDPAFRGLGIGSALMRKAEEKAQSLGMTKMSLEVLGDNLGAIRLYERLGYRITHTTKGFLVRLATKSNVLHKMEKPLEDM